MNYARNVNLVPRVLWSFGQQVALADQKSRGLCLGTRLKKCENVDEGKWWGDLHRLQRLTCLVERGKKRTNNRTMHPTPKKQCSCRLSGSSENIGFERCRSTEGVGILQQDHGVAYLVGCQRLGPTFLMAANIHAQEVVTCLVGVT